MSSSCWSQFEKRVWVSRFIQRNSTGAVVSASPAEIGRLEPVAAEPGAHRHVTTQHVATVSYGLHPISRV